MRTDAQFLYGSSYSSAALEYERQHDIDPVYDSPRMSRRSLRLQTAAGHYGDDSLLDSSHSHSATYSAGGISRRQAKTLRSRRTQQLVSIPVTQHDSGSASLRSCAASDASLLASLLDESCVQESTRIGSFWGLEQDSHLKEHSFKMDHTVTLANGGIATTRKQAVAAGNGYICSNCSIHSKRNEALTAYSSRSSSSSSSSFPQPASEATCSLASTVYTRDRGQAVKTGVLVTASRACVRYAGLAVSAVASVVTLLMQRILLALGCRAQAPSDEGPSPHPVVRLSDVLLDYARWAVTAVMSCITSLSVLLKMGSGAQGHEGSVCDGAHSSYCGGVNVKALATADSHLVFNGSLCDDCKGKQHTKMLTAHAQSGGKSRLRGALWSIIAYTGSAVLQAIRALGGAGVFVLRKLLLLLYLVMVSPGKAAAGAFWWLGTGWYQLVTLMSLLNVFILTRCLPKLLRLLLLLLPLLLLLGLWLWFSSSLLPYVPAVNLTEWQAGAPISLLLRLPQTLYASWGQLSTASPRPPATVTQPDLAVTVSLERLDRLEQQLEQLWGSMKADGRLREDQRSELLGLYQALGQQLEQQTDRSSLGLWVSDLLDQRLTLLREELGKDAAQREQTQTEYLTEQQRHGAQLTQMGALLKALAAKMEEVQQKQETPPQALESANADREARDALLAELRRLEAEMDRIRHDLQGVLGCRGRCEQLDSLQDTVSAQVRRELRALFYGGEQTGQGELPEPLLPWLSARFVSGSDLQGALTALELSILRNVTLQAQQTGQPPCERSVTETVVHAAGAAGMSEEQVKLIVQNALNLYSQDRTGLVDYALESGGGSVLSTRCSETYETKTALMSLFGVPLWYFSQSPRVVIQPDVYPGNCWAFKGSQGYLVIRLSLSIQPTAFSLEHIPKALSPTGNITSAPRQFAVYGLDDEYQEEGKLLGRYIYQEDGHSLQTFPVTEENDRAFQIIEMRVLSNWGHAEYTCLYRFRVHGEPRTQ
ncbi:SUN domain-containing protein 1 isoform X2 [Brienomyrus brachyistius]|uniref:SUN domain-containing protein 1 isoform X2 n=1 Tax=Brienomyrus brachyistius TaxID=42636 RepID=UPI0020B3E6C2|nr:SUN domain-containing protein 1 isoform X2 [Brienomyrus brachyistius]